jgi:acyl-CoA reductase-like NAD-dependent aldehyde dehydrogenase
VFNVLVGDKAVVGGELLSSPAVRKLSFTGSTVAGVHLMRESAATVKRTSMEVRAHDKTNLSQSKTLAALAVVSAS